mmetsp:Transcript_62336/g.167259  ORF Transcript_62336/g.167259 Transcript_62336/m.167259 type:complete len:141 (+) Transcript_62336:308-730(+)
MEHGCDAVEQETSKILMESAPESLEGSESLTVDVMEERLRAIPGVLDVHELHVWRFTPGKVLCTMHVVVDKDGPDPPAVVDEVKHLLHANGIHSSTIQVEAAHSSDVSGQAGGGEGAHCADVVCGGCDLHGLAPPAPSPH